MTIDSATQADPRFYYHSGPADLHAAVEQALSTGRAGVILTGSEVQQLTALSASGVTVPMIIDNGGWRQAIADANRLFASVDAGGLIPMTLQEYVAPLLEAGATRVLTPTLTVSGIGWQPIVTQILSEVQGAGLDERTLTLLPLQSTVFEESNLAELENLLRDFGRPVAVILVGGKHSMAVRNRLAVLRTLISAGLVTAVLASEPLIVSDAAAHGAEIISVGVNGGLRIPSMPSKGGPIFSRDFLPGLFLRGVLELHSPSVFADWYAGQPAPHCPRCARGLTVFDPRNLSDVQAITAHNLHEFADFHDQLLQVDPASRRTWLAQERLQAVAQHPRVARATTGIDKVLTRLIELDGLQPEPILQDAPI